MKVSSSSSNDDGNDGDDDGDDSDGGDDNNGGNNGANGETYGASGSQRGGAISTNLNYYATQDPNSSDIYLSGHDNYSRGYQSFESHMYGLSLASGQQLERSTSSTGFFTYRKDNYDDNFMHHRNSMSK